MVTLYPKRSLVKNIGLDNSGENCGPSEIMEVENNTEKIKVEKIDTAVNSEIFKIYCNHFKSNIVSRAWRTGLNRINKHRLLGKLSRLLKPNRLALSGYYESYEKALEMSTGYNDDAIIEKVSCNQ